MKGLGRSAAVAIAIIALSGALMAAVFGPSGRRAVVISACLALGVQLLGFAVVRLVPREQVMAGWGLGALLRFFALAAYGIGIVMTDALPATPALISLAAFFFLTSLAEPLLLRS